MLSIWSLNLISILTLTGAANALLRAQHTWSNSSEPEEALFGRDISVKRDCSAYGSTYGQCGKLER